MEGTEDMVIACANVYGEYLADNWLSRNQWIDSLYGYTMRDKIKKQHFDHYVGKVKKWRKQQAKRG